MNWIRPESPKLRLLRTLAIWFSHPRFRLPTKLTQHPCTKRLGEFWTLALGFLPVPENSNHRSPANARCFGDGRLALTLSCKSHYLSGPRSILRRSAPGPAHLCHANPFLLNASSNAINRSLSLKLGEGTQNVKEEPAIRRCQVNVVRERNKPDIMLAEVRHCIDQIPNVAAPAIKLPNHHDVKLAAPSPLEQFISDWPRVPLPGFFLFILS